MTAVEKMDAVAREIRAQETVFQMIVDAIPHEDVDVDLDAELSELAEMDTVVGRQG